VVRERLLCTGVKAYKQINNELFENPFMEFIKPTKRYFMTDIQYSGISKDLLSVHGNYSDNAY
jgi:hypothetical protein